MPQARVQGEAGAIDEAGRTGASGAWPTAYPRIPAAVAPPRAESRVRIAAVAVAAALVGSFAGAGAVLLALDRGGLLGPPVAAVPLQVVPAPVVRVSGPEVADQVVAVAEAVRPTVVQVDIVGDGGTGSGNGSGVVYRSDGYIITNNHVVSAAGRLSVTFADGTSERASVVGTDRESDLAVLKVDRTGLPAIAVRGTEELEVGELAVAIGSPFGLQGSVTRGIVSAVDRGVSVRAPDGATVSLPGVVQTDASINPGNSGGPLVDGQGRLIGINSAILTSGTNTGNAGVGFAIPAAYAVSVADELLATGSVRHAFLGVAGDDLTPEVAQRVGVEQGAYIADVTPGTPAAAAGLREGDVIVAVGDTPVTSIAGLVTAVRQADVGDTVRVTYRRDGTDLAVDVTLSEAPTARE